MTDLTVNTVIFCEDVRKEENNKNMLLGIFNGDIVIQQIPAVLFLAFWVELSSRSGNEQVFDVKVEFPGPKDSKMEGKDIKVTFSGGHPTSFAIPRVGYPIEREGEIAFYVRQNNGRWKAVRRKSVKMGPVPSNISSNASLLPSEQSPPAVPAS